MIAKYCKWTITRTLIYMQRTHIYIIKINFDANHTCFHIVRRYIELCNGYIKCLTHQSMPLSYKTIYLVWIQTVPILYIEATNIQVSCCKHRIFIVWQAIKIVFHVTFIVFLCMCTSTNFKYIGIKRMKIFHSTDRNCDFSFIHLFYKVTLTIEIHVSSWREIQTTLCLWRHISVNSLQVTLIFQLMII